MNLSDNMNMIHAIGKIDEYCTEISVDFSADI